MATPLLPDSAAEISEALPIAMMKLDKTGRVLSMNRVCRELLSSMKVPPESIRNILPRHYRSLVRQALRDKQVEEMNWVHNGRSLHLIFKSTRDASSAYLFMVDLTAQNEAKAQLIQSEKMASLGLLVAGLAHEINTPLGAIYSNNDTISRLIGRIRDLLEKEEKLGAPDSKRAMARLAGSMQEVCENTSIAAERLINIVGSLKNFARLDEADFKKADIHEGLESTLTIVEHELKNRIRVEKDYGDSPLFVECHPNRLNQVFMNLLINASQAIRGRGTITIRTSKTGDFVRVSVSDTGIGIPEENISKIFDPGFTTKGVGVGTGLGLSICYKIIQEHQGRVEVQSSPKGTTFTVILPVSRSRKVKSG